MWRTRGRIQQSDILGLDRAVNSPVASGETPASFKFSSFGTLRKHLPGFTRIHPGFPTLGYHGWPSAGEKSKCLKIPPHVPQVMIKLPLKFGVQTWRRRIQVVSLLDLFITKKGRFITGLGRFITRSFYYSVVLLLCLLLTGQATSLFLWSHSKRSRRRRRRRHN